MSRLTDDYDPLLVPDDGPPTRDLKPLKFIPPDPPLPRDPATKTDLDIAERVLDLGEPSPAKPS